MWKKGLELIWRYFYEKCDATKSNHKNIAMEKSILAQLVMQNFMLERFCKGFRFPNIRTFYLKRGIFNCCYGRT